MLKTLPKAQRTQGLSTLLSCFNSINNLLFNFARFGLVNFILVMVSSVWLGKFGLLRLVW